MSETPERKPVRSAAQAAALILFVVALGQLIYAAYFGGGPPLIVMSIMGFGMSFILWRMKPKASSDDDSQAF